MTQRHLSGEVIRTDGDPLLDISAIPQAPAWTADALCAQVDTDGFFPEKGGSSKAAKAVCGRCSVTEKCLAYALAHESGEIGTHTSYGPFGIYGGKSPSERRRILKALRTTGVPA